MQGSRKSTLAAARAENSVALPLIAQCEVRLEHERYVERGDGSFIKEKERVYSYHHGAGYKRSMAEAPTQDVVLGTCFYDVKPPGTFTASMIRALLLRSCPKTRRYAQPWLT